jgi:hypothetical protein
MHWIFFIALFLMSGSILISNIIAWNKRDYTKCPPTQEEKNIYYITLGISGLMFAVSTGNLIYSYSAAKHGGGLSEGVIQQFGFG